MEDYIPITTLSPPEREKGEAAVIHSRLEGAAAAQSSGAV